MKSKIIVLFLAAILMGTANAYAQRGTEGKRQEVVQVAEKTKPSKKTAAPKKTAKEKYDYYGLGISEKEGFRKVGLNGKYGFIDINEKEVIPLLYDDVDNFYEGMAAVKKNNKWGFIDRYGTIVVAIKYDSVECFSEGLAAIKGNGKWGFIDKIGTLIIPIKYDCVGGCYDWSYSAYFYQGKIEVIINNKRFYINKQGECVKDCENAPADHPKAK